MAQGKVAALWCKLRLSAEWWEGWMPQKRVGCLGGAEERNVVGHDQVEPRHVLPASGAGERVTLLRERDQSLYQNIEVTLRER